jgi:hypothetical protein
MAYSYLFSFFVFDDAKGEKDDILYVLIIGILVFWLKLVIGCYFIWLYDTLIILIITF